LRRGSKRLLWLLALGGAAFCTYAVVQLIRYSGSGKWPTAVATVEKIEVRRIQDSDSHHFRPVVLFSFVVSEDYYSGEWVGPALSTEHETRNFMQRNTPIGTKLSAQYNPDNPKLNLLEIDLRYGTRVGPSHSVSEEGSWKCLRRCCEVLAAPFGQLEHWSLWSAADSAVLPQPEPRAVRQLFIVASICSRDVVCAEWPNIRCFEHFLYCWISSIMRSTSITKQYR
jgi:Protein of unknown function (DUF3592)